MDLPYRYAMLNNYLKIAVRNLRRNKAYAFINVAGLSIGLACAMLILLYVKDEVSFDRFHRNGPNIYRIVSKASRGADVNYMTATGLLQGPRFAQNVAGIREFVRVNSGNRDIKTGADIKSKELLFVDSNFLSVFTFPMLDGNPVTCLHQPHSIVLSADEAKRQFGTTNAVGKTMMIKEEDAFVPFTVTGVTANCPENSSLQYNMLVPFTAKEEQLQNNESWFTFFLSTFVVLDPHADPRVVSSQMTRFYEKDARAIFTEMLARYKQDPNQPMGTYYLQPFRDMHLSTNLSATNGLQHSSNPIYSYILSGIALFVLLIACINFVNLTVARSVKRAKEIGIRKVVGSDRRQLVIQFMGESFLLCGIAFILAVLLAQLVLPLFNDLANKRLSLSYLLDVKLVAGYIGMFLLTGLLAGFYPALVLSGYRPVETLYSRFNLKGKNYLQQSLVVLQFTLASFLIIATFTIYAQFDYLTKADLGYDDNNVVMISKDNMRHSEAAAFKAALLKHPEIAMVAPKNGGTWMTGARLRNDSAIGFNYETVDESFLPALKIPLIMGRNFSTDHPADSVQSIIVNEAFVKKAGWTNPLGETVNFNFENNHIYTVIGVVKDYHFNAMNEKIGPQLFTMKNTNPYGMFYVKIKPNTATAALKNIQQDFHQYFPLSPYEYIFKDEQNLRAYESEAKWKQIILFSAVLTIFISCIGLFGLSVLAAEKRTKEIGIRKVLGASVQHIATKLSADFIKLVFIALVAAAPLAWLAASKWLQNYPYRITLNWAIFAGPALLVVTIALCTVSFQAIKAALADPVKSMRTE